MSLLSPRSTIRLSGGGAKTWHSASTDCATVWVNGFAYFGGQSLDASSLAGRLVQVLTDASDCERCGRLRETLVALNGSFALIARTDAMLFAAVDRLRSIPLFYGERSGYLAVSDDALWVKDQVSDTDADPMGVREFTLTGYVTGPDTLFPNVKQLQAGECVWWMVDADGIRTSSQRYYRWIHGDYWTASEDELCRELDHIHIGVFQRLLESTKGHTILVPLSGGLDSRLIAVTLKRLGREDVIAFSYGRPGNRESKISKMIADALGYPWVFVPYDHGEWRAWYRSSDWIAYSRYASRLSSLPHIQDWPAVWVLRDQDRIPADAVFVPGHSADLPAGSRSAAVPEIYVEGPVDERSVVDSILRYHYSLFGWQGQRSDLYSFLKVKILRTLDDLSQFPDSASAFESWDIAERQAKFIVNSVRAYEYWGYDWRVPFWDNDLMAFWSRVPLHLRRGQLLHRRYVSQACKAIGLEVSSHAYTLSQPGSRLVSALKDSRAHLMTSPFVKGVLRVTGSLVDYWSHPLAWYGIISPWQYLRQALHPDALGAGTFCINSILVRSELAQLGIDAAIDIT